MRPKSKKSAQPTRHNIRQILADGLWFSLMVGLGETFVPAFALALGKSVAVVALVATVPIFAGSIIQLVSPWAFNRVRSHRNWVVACGIVQALSFVPFIVAALSGSMSTAVMFATLSLYWAAGLSNSAVWNNWITFLVPKRLGTRVFAYRNRLLQVGILSGLLVAGLFLESGSAEGKSVHFFAWLFGLAMMARFMSVAVLFRQRDNIVECQTDVASPFQNVTAIFKASDQSRFQLIIFLILMAFGVQIAAGFFTPYMLRVPGISYMGYSILLATSFVAKMLFFPFFGRITNRIGTTRMLLFSGLGIFPLPVLWLVHESFIYFLLLQVLGGFVWAGYETASFAMFFEQLRSDERPTILSIFNFLSATAMASGTLIGAVLYEKSWFGFEGFAIVFVFSSLLRLFALSPLMLLSNYRTATYNIFVRVLAIRPSSGSFDRPVVAAISNRNAKSKHGSRKLGRKERT